MSVCCFYQAWPGKAPVVDVPELQARRDEDEGQIPYMSAPAEVYLGYK